MKILVTGGAGFIGSSLVRKLFEMGNEVSVIDNFRRGNKIDRDIQRKIQIHNIDIKNKLAVENACLNIDIVFHLAAVLGVDIVADNPVETMETEALGMLNIANACIVNRVRKIVYASTSGVYGQSAIYDAVKEEYDVSPKSSYSIAKRYNEIYLASLYEEKKLESVSIRYFNVYGPKQDNRMVIPRFFQQAMNNKPITVYGNGDQTRDFTYIDDVVNATILLAKKSKGSQIYNVSSEKEYSINQVAEKIVDVCESKSKITFINAPNSRYDFEVERRFGSSEKLFATTGFKPMTNFDNGLKSIHDYVLASDQPIEF
ncbi:MAG: NAD-dependent epimerase/dehydratase family protein [Pseudomonadota bacterium]